MNQFNLTIQGRNLSYSGPSAYSELTPRQAVGLARVRAGLDKQPGYLVAALTLLYGIKADVLRWVMDADFLRRQGYDPDGIDTALGHGAALLQTLDWIGEADRTAKTLIPHFRLYDYQFGTPNVLRKQLISRIQYVGPEDGLADLTFERFMWADAAYRAKDHARLLAILYTPLGMTWHKSIIDNRAALFTQLDEGLTRAIVRQYEDSLLYLSRCFPAVFEAEKETDEKTKKKKAQGGSWLDVAIAMAQMDVTKIPAIEGTNIYLALKTLQSQIHQNEELKRLSKQP